ncbi:hypothetical protein ENSA5_00420 [Enhygromyxa salina]|uniref:Uncharacterized protein n=1 Tax=Enhygromyxa salina TaxID=215803 RepID=A0A2S9YLA5_9BACT|nr:hypothetical protein ENSA5_00420 [Enhygromyxa salina]
MGGGPDELTYSGLDSEEEEVWGPSAYVVDHAGLNWIADGPGHKVLVINDEDTIVDRYELEGLVRGIEDIAVTETHLYVLAVGGVAPEIGRIGRNDVAPSAWESFPIPTDNLDPTEVTGLYQDASGVVSVELTFGRQHLPLFEADGAPIAAPGAPVSGYAIDGHQVTLVSHTGEPGQDLQTGSILVDGSEVASVETEGMIGDFFVIAEAPKGDLWVHASDVGINQEGALIARSLAYRFSLDGELVSLLEMPMTDELVWVEHRITMDPEGNLRVLSTGPDEATLRRPTSLDPMQPSIMPPGVAPYLPKRHPASFEAPTPAPQPDNLECLYREDIMQRAYEYANFVAVYNNNHMQTCPGRTPVSYFQEHLGQPIAGVAYKYAGYQEVSTYEHAVNNNFTIGDLNTKTDKVLDGCSHGVDCSGFVSKAWRCGHHYTGNLSEVSFELGSTDELGPGDALNKPYSHVRLVAEHLGAWGVKVVESTVGKDRMRVVVRDMSWASAGYAAGYTPIRLDNLCPDAPPPPPPSTHVVFDASGYIPANSSFVPIPPARLLDTREPGGEYEGQLATGQEIQVTVAGRAGMPAAPGLGAVVLNVAIAAPSERGFLAVYPDAPYPGTSNINFFTGEATPNLVLVDPGADGKIEMHHVITEGGSDVVVDAFGYFPPSADLTMVTPARVFDSRTAEFGAAMVLAGTRDIKLAGVGGIPETGVGAVIANVAVVNPADDGFATVYTAGQPQPTTSNLNYTAGQARANLVVIPVSANGFATLFTLENAHYVIDVQGYFEEGADFQPISPIRLRDTRVDDLGPLGHDSTITIAVDSAPTIPADAAAVFGNLTAVAPTQPGHLQVYTNATPDTSNVNFLGGKTVANAVLTALSNVGEIHVRATLPTP